MTPEEYDGIMRRLEATRDELKVGHDNICEEFLKK
jgi:hypothetical protein